MEIESDNEDIDISDDFKRCSARKEGETAKQIGVTLNGDSLRDNGQSALSGNLSRSHRNALEIVNGGENHKLSTDSRAPNRRRTKD